MRKGKRENGWRMGRKGIAHPQCGTRGRDMPLWHPARRLKTAARRPSAPPGWAPKDETGKRKRKKIDKLKIRPSAIALAIAEFVICRDLESTEYRAVCLRSHLYTLGASVRGKVPCTGGSQRLYLRCLYRCQLELSHCFREC